MPCYHPIPAYHFYGKPLVFPPFDEWLRVKSNSAFRKLQIPCGQCVGCRLERRRQWAVRIVKEASMWPSNSFITMTYAPEFMPANGSLEPEHLTKFWKRLRKAISPTKVRYFCCGEYGDLFKRPHYHAIVFNHDFDDLEEQIVQTVEGVPKRIRVSKLLYSKWGMGRVDVGKVTFESASYVAGYCMKKVSGPAASGHYGDLHPEFARMSNKPGIGGTWFDQFSDDVFPDDSVVCRGFESSPPRYFLNRLDKTRPAMTEAVKYDRYLSAEEAEWSPDSWVDERVELQRLEGHRLYVTKK